MMLFDKESQNKVIHKHLLKYGDITSIQAIRLYTITRLASRINDLKKAGVPIHSEVIHDPVNPKRHWSLYKIK